MNTKAQIGICGLFACTHTMMSSSAGAVLCPVLSSDSSLISAIDSHNVSIFHQVSTNSHSSMSTWCLARGQFNQDWQHFCFHAHFSNHYTTSAQLLACSLSRN